MTGGEVFYTSDPHLGHTAQSFRRGFATSEEWDGYWASYWRDTVRDSDTVYILGDLAMSASGYIRACGIIAGLPGRKYLVFGNHDAAHPQHSKQRPSVVSATRATFVDAQPFFRRKANGHELLMSHYPYESFGDGIDRPGSRFNQFRLPDMGLPLLHGHTHGTEQAHGHMFHVGWDAHKRFVTQSEIIDWLGSLDK